MNLTIGYLYGNLMNIYGDTGNIITLQKRCQWRNIEVSVKNISVLNKLKSGDCDIYFFGGGQDHQQILVARDLAKKSQVLLSDIEKGVPLLSICGGYQLLGQYYLAHNGAKLPGIGLFGSYTIASNDRMISNIVIESTFGKLVGFENHSGKTYLKKGTSPLGKIIKGFGNNGEDHTEGCVYKNAIGCYMHGSLLPKNPILADWLIAKALEIKYGKKIELTKLDDQLELKAQQNALLKFG